MDFFSDADDSDFCSDQEDILLEDETAVGSSSMPPACRYTVIPASELEEEQARPHIRTSFQDCPLLEGKRVMLSEAGTQTSMV
jgi:hypothetical protein